MSAIVTCRCDIFTAEEQAAYSSAVEDLTIMIADMHAHNNKCKTRTNKCEERIASLMPELSWVIWHSRRQIIRKQIKKN